MKKFSIVWKIRQVGFVTFRRDLEAASLTAAILRFRDEEPTAYITDAYEHMPISSELLAGVLNHVEQLAIAGGTRSLGD